VNARRRTALELSSGLVVAVFSKGAAFARDLSLAAEVVSTQSADASDLLLIGALLTVLSAVGLNYRLTRGGGQQDRSFRSLGVLVASLTLVAMVVGLSHPVAAAFLLIPIQLVGANAAVRLIRSDRFRYVQLTSLVHFVSTAAIVSYRADSAVSHTLFFSCFGAEALLLTWRCRNVVAVHESPGNPRSHAAIFALGLVLVPAVDLLVLRYRSIGDLADYQTGARIPTAVLSVVIGGLVLQIAPHTRSRINQFQAWYRSQVGLLLAVSSGCAVAIGFVGWPMLKALSGTTLNRALTPGASRVFITFACLLPINALLLLSTRVLVELEDSRFVLFSLAATVVVNTGLDLAFVGSYGSFGIALASVACQSAMCLLGNLRVAASARLGSHQLADVAPRDAIGVSTS
jgi:hypothetical protein